MCLWVRPNSGSISRPWLQVHTGGNGFGMAPSLYFQQQDTRAPAGTPTCVCTRIPAAPPAREARPAPRRPVRDARRTSPGRRCDVMTREHQLGDRRRAAASSHAPLCAPLRRHQPTTGSCCRVPQPSQLPMPSHPRARRAPHVIGRHCSKVLPRRQRATLRWRMSSAGSVTYPFSQHGVGTACASE